MNSHAGRYPYTCPHCGKGTTNPNHLKEHLSKHTGVNYFTCERCGQSFRFQRELKRHSIQCSGAAKNADSDTVNAAVNIEPLPTDDK